MTDTHSTLSRTQLYLLAIASAVVTANAYYIHPIISEVGAHFGVSDAMIGIVPAANQIALALGIFLLLPLGDWVSNKRLTAIFTGCQFLAIVGMALAQDYALFVASSTLLGFVTIVPYLLPAYVSKRVPAGELGRVNAFLTTGIIAGILLARAGSGVIAEYFGWRTVYYIAAGLLLAMSILLPLVMDTREQRAKDAPRQSYLGLLVSIFPIVRKHPEVLLSGAIQALGFGTFLSVWMGLGLHLPDMGYGTDVVGYLALFAIFNLVTTPPLGKWADRVGPHRARFTLAFLHLAGTALLLPFGHSIWLLMIPIVMTNIPGPAIDVANRMTFLGLAPDIRTRLMTVYIVMMFVGGGLASWAGTAVYDWAGWTGNAVLALGLSLLVVALSAISLRRQQRAAN